MYRALARRLGELDLERPGLHDALEGGTALRASPWSIRARSDAPRAATPRPTPRPGTRPRALCDGARRDRPRAHGRIFSFNVAGGRCEACSGEGFETVEMQFLADVRLICPSCRARFKDEVLAVERRGSRSPTCWR